MTAHAAAFPVGAGGRSLSRLEAAGWCLGAAIVATCLGMTLATFRGDGTSINSFLFLNAELSHAAARRLERLVMSGVLVLSVAALFRPQWPLLLPVAAYIMAEALAGWHQRGYTFSEWALVAHAPRYLTPLAVVLLALGSDKADTRRSRRWVAGEWCLRIALATVFLVHGLESIKLHPGFVDLIIGSGYNLAGLRISEAAAGWQLRVIGIVDVGVAAALLFRLSPAVLWWAAFWGALTALSRLTANGWGAYPDLLVRATHYLGPIALWLIVRRRTATGPLPADAPVPEKN